MGARELDPYLYQNSKFKTRTFIQTGFSGPSRKSMDPNSTALYTGSIPRPTHLLGVYGWTETCTQTNKKKWGQILVPYPDAGTRVLWVFGYPFSSTLRLRFIFSTKQKKKNEKRKRETFGFRFTFSIPLTNDQVLLEPIHVTASHC